MIWSILSSVAFGLFQFKLLEHLGRYILRMDPSEKRNTFIDFALWQSVVLTVQNVIDCDYLVVRSRVLKHNPKTCEKFHPSETLVEIVRDRYYGHRQILSWCLNEI
jgi:hypothetical protein